jgi:hypothetical protein
LRVSADMAAEVLGQRVERECDQLDRMNGLLDLALLTEVLSDDTLVALKGQVADCRTSVQRAARHRGDGGWAMLADAAAEGRRLRGEIFALVQGQLFRSAGLDGRVSAAAGRLLEYVRRRCVIRGVLTTFSPDVESVDHTIGLVRLQYPGTTVWDLPFCVHEFGHHAVRELPHVQPARRAERPLQEALDGPFGIRAGLSTSHAHELVADVFATCALGAAYPLACLVQRVDPARVGTDSDTHPSWARRVAAMLAALRHLGTESGDLRYADTADETVLPAWQSIVGTAAPAAPDQQRLDAFVRNTVRALHRHAGALRYRDGDWAVQVRAALTIDPGAAERPAGTTPAAVVDGAWRWRQQDPERFARGQRQVNELALTWCANASFDRGNP